ALSTGVSRSQDFSSRPVKARSSQNARRIRRPDFRPMLDVNDHQHVTSENSAGKYETAYRTMPSGSAIQSAPSGRGTVSKSSSSQERATDSSVALSPG